MNITWFSLITGIVLVVLALPYAQIETLTRIQSDSISEYTAYCDFPPKYVKVSLYNKLDGDLRIMCVHPNPDQSTIVTLNYRKESWEVVKRKKMYSGAPTWPWYL